jgi:hypothetical protein
VRHLWIILVLALLAGCGGSGGTGGGGSTSGSAAADLKAISKVEAVLRQYMDMDGPAWASKAAVAMRTMPEFKDVEDDGLGTVTATLASGVPYAVVANRPRTSGVSRPLAPVLPLAGEVPGSGLAVVMDAFQEDFSHVTTAGAVAQRLSDAGYRLVGGRVLGATMKDLMSLRSAGRLGVFYIDGHGFRIPDYRTKTYSYGMITGSPVPTLGPGEEDPYLSLINRRMVGYSTIVVKRTKDGKPEPVRHYYVNERFATEYYRFASRSVVWPNTCWSSYSAPTFHPLGAGLVVGWTNSVTDGVANAAQESLFRQMSDPDGIVNGWEETKARMEDAKLTFDPATGARLSFLTGPSGGDHVIPEVESAIVLPGGTQIELAGTFGPVKGQILGLVDGEEQEMDVVSWSPTRVVISYDADIGGVRAVVDGVKGNLLSLFRWSIEGPDGGPFTAYMPIRVYVAAMYSRKERLVYADQPDAGAGPRGPIVFYADVLRNPDARIIGFKVFDAAGKSAVGDVWVTSPTGKRTKIISSTDKWTGDPGKDSIWGFDTWKLYR